LTQISSATTSVQIDETNEPNLMNSSSISASDRLTKARERLKVATFESFGLVDETNGLRKETRVRELILKVAEPEVKYDAVKLEEGLFKQPGTWLFRNVQLFIPLTRFTLSVLSDIYLKKERKNRKMRARELMLLISNLGPAIIKAGQALASRPDLLPKEYLDELQKLQDRLPPFSNIEAHNVISDELGRPWDEVFEFIKPDPIAAASIGQVYKAKLKSNGHTVAVKVQRPGCEDTISLDLYILRWYSSWFTKALTTLGRNVNLVSIIDDFGELIFREIDYRAEMVNCQRFAELYANIPGVYVPKVYDQLTKKRLLTMEWVDGLKVVDRTKLLDKGINPSKIVDTLVQCSLRQMLENGLFHADPHAGNLLVMENGNLCFLDFGMVSYVEANQRYGIMEAVVHLVNRDFKSLANLYKRLGFIPSEQDTSPIVTALEKALPDVLNASVSEFNFKNVINKLGDVMYTFPFSLPPYYIAIIRCLGVLEGVAIQADPQFRIISDAYPYIASRLLTDSSPELQKALQQLVFKDGQLRWDRFGELLKEAQFTRDYDVTMALNQMLDFLLSERGTVIREKLRDQIVDGIGEAGTASIDYISSNFRQISLGSIPSILNRDSQALDKLMQTEDFPQELQSLIKIVQTVSNSEGFDPRKILPLLRRLVSEPEIQKISILLAQSLSERVVSRIIRRAFNVPQQSRIPSTQTFQHLKPSETV